MPGLDQISQMIGGMQADVRNLILKVDEAIAVNMTRHDAIDERVTSLEHESSRRQGFVAAIAAGSGALGVGIGSVGKVILAKLGLGA